MGGYVSTLFLQVVGCLQLKWHLLTAHLSVDGGSGDNLQKYAAVPKCYGKLLHTVSVCGDHVPQMQKPGQIVCTKTRRSWVWTPDKSFFLTV